MFLRVGRTGSAVRGDGGRPGGEPGGAPEGDTRTPCTTVDRQRAPQGDLSRRLLARVETLWKYIPIYLYQV